MNLNYESMYRDLCWWKQGSDPVPDPHARWQHVDDDGIEWLCDRMDSETDEAYLYEAGGVLSEFSQRMVPIVLAKLSGDPSSKAAEFMLLAFAWAWPKIKEPGELAQAVERYLRHNDPDVRCAAAEATLALPESQAISLLDAMLKAEPDDMVRESIRSAMDR